MEPLPDDAPAPRLCHMIKWPDFDGYGFNLHAERSNPGQFIGKIDDNSPAQTAGLREGDRIVEVNGVNISNENHRQVVERIKSDPNETKLLVVDLQADLWYRERDLVVKSTQMNVVYRKTPVPRPQQAQQQQSSGNVDGAPSPPVATSPSGSSPSEQHREPKDATSDGATPATTTTTSTTDPSSMEQTSDFNDDSIEPQQQQPEKQAAAPKQQSPVSPPMSPDSGKGDDEPASGTVTFEAEINRQSPVNRAGEGPLSGGEQVAASKQAKQAQDQKQFGNNNNNNSIQLDSLSSDEQQQKVIDEEANVKMSILLAALFVRK